MARRTTREFTSDMIAETWEALLILICHSVVVAAVLLLGKGIEILEHAMHSSTGEVSLGRQAVEFGIEIAEVVTAYGLIIIGGVSSLWTFIKRRREV